MENSQIGIVEAVKDGFNRYADFSGVSSRAQYWYFALASFLASLAASMLVGNTAGNLVSLATLLPTIAVGIRRMHDVGKSGWFILIPIYNLILAISPSQHQSS